MILSLTMVRKRLGEILVEQGLITEEQLQNALAEQYLTKEFLGTILTKSGTITEKDLLKILGEQFSIPYQSIQHRYLDLNLSKKFSSALIMEHNCFPIEEDDLSVTLAIINPLDVMTIGEARKIVAPKILNLVLTSSTDMSAVITKYRKFLKSSLIGIIEKMGG